MGNRKKLLELIEKNNIPLTPNEAREHVDNLSDEEVELLISTYEGLEGAEGFIEEVVKEAEPEEYKKVKDEYEAKLKLDKEEYEKELQKIEGEADVEKDKIEDKIIKESKSAIDEMNNVIDKTENAREELIKISESNLQ
jgi:hypothetical protein